MEALIVAGLGAVAAGLNYLRTRKIDKRVSHEFSNNGGSSARDLLDRIAAEQIRQGESIDLVSEQMAAHLRDHK